MNVFVETALKNFCSSHGAFGESSIFVRFERGAECNENARNGFNSGMIFGKIVYRTLQNEENVSAPLVLKITKPEHLCKDHMLVQYFNEIFFYTKTLPIFRGLSSLEHLLPQFYDSYVQSNDQNTDILLIYEDLGAQGFRTVHERYSFLDLDHLTLMLRKLGQFHSYSYFLKTQNPKEFHALGKWFHYPERELFFSVPNYFRLFGEIGVRRLRQDPNYSNRLAKIDKILENAETYMMQVNTMKPEEPMSVLVHGDYLRGNVMFKYENNQLIDLKIIDMATCRIASPVIDLSLVFYLNADQQTRSQYWDQLIVAYHAGLSQKFGGIGVPNKKSILKEFTHKAVHGYFIASHFLQVLIEMDRGNMLGDFPDFIPAEYASRPMSEIPENVFKNIIDQMSSEESAEAMADILRDMIDRNFI